MFFVLNPYYALESLPELMDRCGTLKQCDFLFDGGYNNSCLIEV